MKDSFHKAMGLFNQCDFRGFLETINPLIKYFLTNQMIILIIVSLVALEDDEVLEQFLVNNNNVNDDAVRYFIKMVSMPAEARQPEEDDCRYPLKCLALGTRLMRQGDFNCAKPYLAICAEYEGFESDIASTLIHYMDR